MLLHKREFRLWPFGWTPGLSPSSEADRDHENLITFDQTIALCTITDWEKFLRSDILNSGSPTEVFTEKSS
jgi:hypothetical protein